MSFAVHFSLLCLVVTAARERLRWLSLYIFTHICESSASIEFSRGEGILDIGIVVRLAISNHIWHVYTGVGM